VLDEFFGNEPLGAGLTHTLITSYDIQNRQPVFFKSWREDHRSVQMKHAARATSAAPTYFEPALVPVGGATRALIDGGVFINSPSWGKAGWLAPLLGCMFDGAADAANYQMKMFLGSRYVRMQTSLAVASDDMDNATNGNVENLKAEAGTLIQTHKAEMGMVCGVLQEAT